MSKPNPLPSPAPARGSGPSSDAPPSGVGANQGGGGMPQSLDALARAVPPGPPGGPAPAPEDPGGPEPRSALTSAVLGNVAALPFDGLALYTGHEHWHLEGDERALMSEAAHEVATSYGLVLNPKSNPWGCLILGLVGFGVPRLVKEIQLLRAEMAERKDAPAA